MNIICLFQNFCKHKYLVKYLTSSLICSNGNKNKWKVAGGREGILNYRISEFFKILFFAQFYFIFSSMNWKDAKCCQMYCKKKKKSINIIRPETYLFLCVCEFVCMNISFLLLLLFWLLACYFVMLLILQCNPYF